MVTLVVKPLKVHKIFYFTPFNFVTEIVLDFQNTHVKQLAEINNQNEERLSPSANCLV